MRIIATSAAWSIWGAAVLFLCFLSSHALAQTPVAGGAAGSATVHVSLGQWLSGLFPSRAPYVPYVVRIKDAPADVIAGHRALDCAGLDRLTVAFCGDYADAQGFAAGYSESFDAPALALSAASGALADVGLIPLSPLLPAAGAAQNLVASGWSQFNVMHANDDAIVWQYLHDMGLIRTIQNDPGAYLVIGPHPQ